MNIELYPEFEEVFHNDDLKGIFFPLCKISGYNLGNNTPLFFLSHNGLFPNNGKGSSYNQSDFYMFDIVDGKYQFNGTIELYEGYKHTKELSALIEEDFGQNAPKYIDDKFDEEDFSELIKAKFKGDKESWEIDYYIKTYYQYLVNKFLYKTKGSFGAYQQHMMGYHKADLSPIVYLPDSEAFSSPFEELEINKQYHLPEEIDLADYEKIGKTEGFEFFVDGNNTFVLLHKTKQEVLCINYYS